MNYRAAYTRLFLAMSVSDAKEILGFPPNYNPTPQEINKAWRSLAFKNHPDQGGSHEKMVEVNVAKDILEGKRREDRTPRREADPEEMKRRKDAIKRQVDIGVIKGEAEKAGRVMSQALSEASNVIGAAWRADLKEFLTDDFADAVDTIHDQAEEGMKTAEGSDKQTWQKVVTLTQGLSSGALRLASKFASLKKKLASVTEEPTIEGLSALFADMSKFVAAFKAHRADSGKLMTLIVTNEALPAVWDDIYTKSHQRTISYDHDFQRFSASQLKAAEDQVERSVDAVTVKLENDYGITGKFPAWRKWRIPADFQDAVEIVEKAPASTKNASVVGRVVARYRS